jgi:hypothetical protein
MTSGQGHGLTPMLVGVINRYSKADVSSPEIVYVDRDCCGSSPLQTFFEYRNTHRHLALHEEDCTDIDGFYNMACDNLECMTCRHRVLLSIVTLSFEDGKESMKQKGYGKKKQK